jgi:hypothetical protein
MEAKREEDGWERPSTDELIEAMGAPGPLLDQPAVQRLLRERAGRSYPTLTLIKGGA